MGYVIAAGIGLALGIGLLIWALRERGRRQDAEERALKLTLEIAQLNVNLAQYGARCTRLTTDREAAEVQLQKLRELLDDAQALLKTSTDIKTVKNWLDEVLRKDP